MVGRFCVLDDTSTLMIFNGKGHAARMCTRHFTKCLIVRLRYTARAESLMSACERLLSNASRSSIPRFSLTSDEVETRRGALGRFVFGWLCVELSGGVSCCNHYILTQEMCSIAVDEQGSE